MEPLQNYLNHTWPTTRESDRRKLDVPISVRHHGMVLRGWCNDLCIGGVGFTVAAAFPLGEELKVEFVLPSEADPIETSVVVRWSNGFRHGCEFLKSSTELHSALSRFLTRVESTKKKTRG